MTGSAPVDPHGPVFVSYRHSDGATPAARLAWLLRAAGLPVWHDETDLPPGDTSDRLEQALAAGLSGAVLLVTPEIELSGVVRTVELPALLGLETDPAFVLAVGNTVRTADGGLDYTAPDRLLGQPAGTLSRLKQHSADNRAGLARIARELVLHRTSRLAPAAGPRALHVSVQTRTSPHAADHDPADLPVRLRPPDRGRLPSRDGLKDLRRALPLLPEAVAVRGARSVRITGGGHLTAAFAVGSALPATLVGDLTVEDNTGQGWQAPTVSAPPGPAPLTRVAGHGATPVRPVSTVKAVLAYVDLLPDRSDDAYSRFLDDHPARFDAWAHIRPSHDVPLDPAATGPLVAEAASRLRTLSQAHGNAELHLLLRCPFPTAVLLGRLLNTLRVAAYEWDRAPDGDADTRPVYVPSVAVAATDADGPITAVLMPKP
jgi:hypothetical protein